ncbi:hypothetical protein FB451DRAFT_1364420 [Mycena latifolia]|nr:hypothetical protein FB451DRAFT_1364420 [Mycena latifolia]
MHLFSSRTPASIVLSPLSAILTSLNTMAGVAQLAGVPYIQPIILLAAAIVTTIQQLKENTKAFVQLAHDTFILVQAMAQVRTHSVELEQGVREFTGVLQTIQSYLQEHLRRNAFLRLFGAADDASKIQDYRARIKLAREVFEMQMHMRTHENIIHILRYRSERNSAQPPAYTAEEAADIYPTIPENVRRIAEDDFECLLPILGVYGVFQKPPSIKQMARVLGLAEDEVRAIWEPISSYLDGLDSDDGKTRCIADLERIACRASGIASIDSATYHNMVARWCLVGPKGGSKHVANFGEVLSLNTLSPRDVFYASDSWVYHVCHSSPSEDLCDALTQSEIPVDPEDLPEIIAWLEQIQSDEVQWASLLSTYQARRGELSD